MAELDLKLKTLLKAKANSSCLSALSLSDSFSFIDL